MKVFCQETGGPTQRGLAKARDYRIKKSIIVSAKMTSELWVTAIVAPLVSGLVGAAVVYHFGVRQLRIQRRMTFAERQLSEFYAPLAGMRTQILAKSEMRLRVSSAADAAWREICESYRGQIMHNHKELFAPFKKITEYENKQLEIELLPLYRRMLELFTSQYHLADAETRTHYQEFLEFVEIWNRAQEDSLPTEVLIKLKHDEDKVKPFYQHLLARMQELQDEIAQRKPSKRVTAG